MIAKEYTEEMKNIEHVKHLATTYSNENHLPIGIFEEGEYFQIEVVRHNNYICQTYRDADGWHI